jgi:chromosome segregation ATPase
LEAKEKELQQVQEELTAITNELDLSRKGLEDKQIQSQKLSEAQHKIQTIETAMEQEYDELKGQMAKANKSIADIGDIIEAQQDEEMFDAPDLSTATTEAERREQLENQVNRMQAKVKAYTANNVAIDKEIRTLDEQRREKEMQCKKLIAACCNLPIEKIDDLVEPLILAIESDPPDLDLARINGFMDKIKTQGAFNNESSHQLPHSPQPESATTP